MGFSTTDSLGNLKVITGSGTTPLSDPLSVAQGGFGFNTFPRGGIFYAPSDNTFALRIPDQDFDMDVAKVLSNVLYPGEVASTSDPTLGLLPRWVRKDYFVTAGGGQGKVAAYDNRGMQVRFGEAVDANPGYVGVQFITGPSGTGGNVIDDTSTWYRLTTTNNSNNYVTLITQFSMGIAAYDSMFAEATFRTSATATDVRFMFYIGSNTPINNTDNQTISGFGISHSTPRSDGGFVSWRNGTESSSIGTYGTTVIHTYAASTVYTMSVDYPNPTVGFAQLKISDGVTTNTQTVTLGSEAQATTRLFAVLAFANSSGSGTNSIDLGSSYCTQQSQTVFT